MRLASCGERNPKYKHGLSSTPTYQCWRNMLQRCTNPKDKDYVRYAGRGIRICKRWLRFENFLADMGVRPAGLTLERNDNDGDYRPSNCRWATQKEQSANKRQPPIETRLRGKDHPMWGKRHSRRTRKRISDKRLAGLAAGTIVPWNRDKQTGQKVWNKGKKMSAAFCRKISLACMGRIPWNKKEA